MGTSIFAIVAGLIIAAFIIFPMGTKTTSGTRYAPQEPFSWAEWRKEARLALWGINPVTAWVEVRDGYEVVGGALVRTFAFIVVLSALGSAAALIGWGLFAWAL